MRILTLAIAVTVAAAASRADDAAKDLSKLQGSWVAEKVLFNGKDYTKYKLRFVFKDSQITVEGDDEVKKEYAKIGCKLDPSTTPRCFDITIAGGSQEGAKMEGIYDVKGDELRICVKVFGNDRPSEFTADDGSSQALVVLKKEK